MLPPALNEEMFAKISGAVRDNLSDALNTQKYSKLESYSRVDQAEDEGALHCSRKRASNPKRPRSSII